MYNYSSINFTFKKPIPYNLIIKIIIISYEQPTVLTFAN